MRNWLLYKRNQLQHYLSQGSNETDGDTTMAHYLVKNAVGDIKHITGKPAMVTMVTHGWKVIEQWFGK